MLSGRTDNDDTRHGLVPEEVTSPEALARARRRLLTGHPDPTSANAFTPGRPTDEQLRVLAASDWAPPRIAALDTNTLTTADPITRALLAESVRETLERRLAAERPHGTYDDTRAGHDAFSRGVVEDYDHGNHHLVRATIRPADPGLVTRAALSVLGLPDTDATIIDELAGGSDPNPLMRVLEDASLLDLDRYAAGRGLRYSRVGTALMLAAPNDQRLADAIDTVAAAALGAGAHLTDVTTQYIDEEKALASIGIDLWATRSSEEPTGKADRILYVGRDGARVHVKAGRVLVDAPGSLPATSVPKYSVTRIVLSGNVGLSAGTRSWAMRSGVDVVCLSRRGSYQSTLIGANRGGHASRLLAQVALFGTVSGASAWPPASSARKSAAKSTWDCAGECGEGLAAFLLSSFGNENRSATLGTPKDAGFDSCTVDWEPCLPIRPIVLLILIKREVPNVKHVVISEA